MKTNPLSILWFAPILLTLGLNTSFAGNKQASSNCSQKNYESNVVPKKMTVPEKKQRFRCLLEPAIDDVFTKLAKQYQLVKKAVETGVDTAQLKQLRKKYKVDNNQALLKAIKPHPQSIAIAQAAMESAWATSRFTREANNLFGVWSFNKSEPRIAAGKKRGSKTIWVKKYPSIKASIEDYYLVLAKGRAFSGFRNLKMKTSDPYQLVKKLDKYSERKAEYGKELASMIKYNKFYKLDKVLK